MRTGITNQYITCIHPGAQNNVNLPDETLQKVNGSPIVATLARLEKRKGHSYILSAIAKLKNEYPNILYVIAGSGEELSNLKNIVHRTNIEQNVLFVGNINNNEKLSHMVTRFDSGIGYYNSRLDHFFRDWRENKSIPMDSEVLKNLFSICEEVLGRNATINVQITSGYRTQKTNEKLRVRSKNVAKNSFHIAGKAIDFAIKEVSQKKLRSAAKNICSGGLGFYPGFIHIDSGPVRRWGI